MRKTVVALALVALASAAELPKRPSLRTRRVDEPRSLAVKPAPEPPAAELLAAAPSKGHAVSAAVLAGVLYLAVVPSGKELVSSITSNHIVRKASKKALGGGLSGMCAGVVQVLTLMWLRTAMNYQYRYGSSTGEALRALYAQGGIGRFYQGVGWALLQTPLSRFGDTAANTGVIELLGALEATQKLPIGLRTACASFAGSMWRIGITPLDTLKTTLQVEGPEASALLMKKVQAHGLGVLYNGAGANALASFVGSFPWFWVFNQMDAALPAPPPGVLILKLLRSAALGVSATCVSDIISNSLRVMKTTRQTSSEPISYAQAVAQIVEKDGYLGLFTRGLGTRLITNCIQASIFTIVWKLLEERLNAKA